MSTAEPDKLIEFRVTFTPRMAQLARIHGVNADPEGWVAVPAIDGIEAQQKIHDKLGNRWAYMYHPDQDDYPGPGGPYYERGETARII